LLSSEINTSLLIHIFENSGGTSDFTTEFFRSKILYRASIHERVSCLFLLQQNLHKVHFWQTDAEVLSKITPCDSPFCSKKDSKTSRKTILTESMDSIVSPIFSSTASRILSTAAVSFLVFIVKAPKEERNESGINTRIRPESAT